MIPLAAILIRNAALLISMVIGTLALIISFRAWRHSGSVALGFIALLFAGWTTHSSYFFYWYLTGKLASSTHFFIMPNLASLIMNAGAIGFVVALFKEPLQTAKRSAR